jgi:hypothetical protein
MSDVVSALFAGLGSSALRTLVDAYFFDYIRGSGIVFRTEVARASNTVKSITAEAMDSMIEGDPDPNVALKPSGIVNIMDSFIKTVAQASLFLSTDIAGDLYTRMLQQGFANAMQTTIAGALQSLLAVWRGGYPLSYDQASILIEAIEDIDKDVLGLLLAQSGSNVPTSYFYVKRGFDQYVENQLINLRTQLFEISNKLNDLIAWKVERSTELALRRYSDALNVVVEAYNKAISLIDLVCERALSRLQELKNECETTLAWYNYSLEHPDQPIISEEEANLLGNENYMEADKVYSSVTSILEKIDDKLSTFDYDVSTVISNIDDAVTVEVDHLNKVVQQGLWSVNTLIDTINEALKILVAYRNAVDLRTSPKTNLTASLSSEVELAGMYQVRFYVKTDETPLQGANVILYRVDRAFHGETDSDGVVTFNNVPSGVYNYMVVLDGYAHVEDVVKVYENVDITVVLKPLT